MVGPHVDAGPRVSADRERRELDVSEAAHAQLRQRKARSEAAWHVDAGIHHARAARERLDRNSQLVRTRDVLVRQRVRAIVHSKVSHKSRSSYTDRA